MASVVDSQPGASSGELSAIIDWGNGDTSIGLVTAAPEGGGLFDVLGSEVYTSAATFPITVQITDATGEETTASGTAAVAGAALTAYPLSVAATEGQNFNGAVVTVLDANLSAVAADFNAQINWGDGTTGPGTVTAVTGTPGRFVVTGSHTYTEAGLYNLVIALSDRGAVSATATATATAQVADSPLSLADATLHAVAGTAFASTVGTLTDPNPYAVAADFTATIRWGDGTSSIGSVAADPEVSGRFEVTGTHAYAENGAYAVIVQVVDRGGATSFTVSSTTVSPASIIAAGVTLAASAGAPYVGTVATVADGNPGDTAGALTAMIAWGDGQSSLAVVTPDPHEAGTFDIGGTHEYTATGTYAVTVQVVDADGNMSTASGTATVTEPALVATAVTISPSVAVPYTGAVLTFTGGSLDPLSAFSATIDWGDGTTTAGTIAPPTVPGGPFQVNGTHSYQAIGAYSVTATVTNSDGNSASAIDTANVSNMAATSRTVAASEGAAFDGIVATFTDAETELGASAFSATIDWGDGTTTVGTVAPDASVAGQFDVAGVHTFNAAGAPAVVVQIAGPAGAGTAVVVGSAFVADAPLSATADAVDATEGQAFTGLVAYFSDAGPAGSSSQYWALIGWGDGQVSAGAIAPDPTVPGRFDVSGTHIYEMNGSYSVSVQIVDVGGCTVATTGTASVTDAPLLASFGSVSALPGVVFSGTVATFTEGPSDPLSAFSATIDWGDGTSATATIIPPAAPGEPFQVDGTHAYESAGTYNIVVSVLDADGGSATATGAAQIASVAGTGHPINATAGDSFTEGVASFASADPAALPSQFTATIAWGDGHSSSGVVTDDPHSPGRFLVTGTHVYQSNGSFSVLVHVTDQSGGTASIASLAVVADAPLVVNVGVISPFLETPYNGVVATFREGPTDPLSVFSATIDWGDGTTTAGTVVAPATTGGPFQVEGAHNYQAIGAFAVVITVRNTDGNVVFATGTADVSQIAAAGTSIAVNQGATFNDVVATFTGTEPGLAATAISATIDWGDGTTSTGVVAADTSVVGQFDVTGAHAYAAAGAPGFTVRIVGPAGAGTAVVVGKAVVADIPLVATGASVTATKAQIFTGLVASFDGSFDTASDYTTTIDWGDGTTTAGTLALNGTTSDAFDILGTHAYGADGTYAVLVEVTSVDGGSTSATTTAVVTSAPLLVSFGTVSATLGTPYNGVVGSFTGGSSDEASAFSATINWGDGTTVAGVVTAPAAPGEPFQVLGTHVYQVVGDFVVTLTVHDADGQAASAAGSVDVTDMTGDGVPIMAVQGTAYFGRVATFTDPNAGLVAGNYSAVIHWGDGDSSTGVVLPAPGGNFVVTGTHTFDTPGAYDTLVTLVSPSGQSLAIAGTATATAAPLIAASAPVSATAGAGFQGEVATFGQAGVVSTSVFSATIDWGDGTTAAATIGQGPAVGQFTVTGGHSYASPGSYNTVTTIVDSNGTWATAVGTAEVSNMSATPQPVIATEGTSFNGVVATFTDPGQGLGASDFTANVVWGDGTSSAGSITVDPAVPGQFDVTATHAFAKSGTYATLVRITDPSDYRALVAGSATVAAVPLTATGLMATATEGHRFTGAVVTFSDPNPYAAASDFSASVVWADGQITVGTVTAASNVAGLFNVTATTVFNSTGSYSVTVQITDRSGSATSAVGLVQVAEAPLSVTAVAVSAAPGQAYNGWVAQFQKGPTDEAGSFSATIDWGDGTTTAGLVSGSAGPGGPFWVGGEHAYTVTGIYTVVVTVVDVDGTTASVTGAADVSNMTAAGFSLQGTQGTTLSGRVATVGAVSLGLQASDFTAAIDWGDGQTSAGTVVSDP
ncbi:MAG: hypothetical protein P4L84_05950, partial [Isosphaeraceae bacterium]|nr:hypothetical protein [Isosphaeraceae bacterium]